MRRMENDNLPERDDYPPGLDTVVVRGNTKRNRHSFIHISMARTHTVDLEASMKPLLEPSVIKTLAPMKGFLITCK